MVHVADGDTLDARIAGAKVRVRVADIDAPEKAQPFGDEARLRLKALVLDQPVRVVVREKDQYGRSVAHVFTEDGRNIAEVLVEEGLAVEYRRYSKNPRLKDLETAAREARRGLWSQDDPVRPRLFRKRRRGR